MDFVNFVMALSPILVVLVGILGFKQSAKRVSPIALVWTLILAFTYFNVTGASFADNVKTLDPLVWKGIKEGLKIVLMVFGAFTILNLLRETGAIDDVKSTIARISDDRRVQLIVIGMMLPIFLEGAAGAGAPAAIAAPFLVALGFDPVTSIAIILPIVYGLMLYGKLLPWAGIILSVMFLAVGFGYVSQLRIKKPTLAGNILMIVFGACIMAAILVFRYVILKR